MPDGDGYRTHAEIAQDTEDVITVEEALQAVDTGSAGHWPTVAKVLAEEVHWLRAERENGPWH
jgi:hypothetical protein